MSGRFLHRVTLQTEQGPAGDDEPTYGDSVTWIPCKIVATSGQETYRGRQLETTVNFVVEMRTRVVAPTDRLTIDCGPAEWVGISMNVEWVRHLPYDDGRPAITEVYCTELAS